MFLSILDVLLCHDDELDDRRMAYILYLVPDDWSATDGGTLDLFDTDGRNTSCVSPDFIPLYTSSFKHALWFGSKMW